MNKDFKDMPGINNKLSIHPREPTVYRNCQTGGI